MNGFIDFWYSQGIQGFLLIFIFYFVFEFPRQIILDYIVLLIHFLRKKYNKKAVKYARENLWSEKPFVSIIIPGKDEGKNYYNLVNSLQQQSYQNFEIIIVDDGSGDYTRYIGRDLERRGKIDKFIRNEVRGGKASAANLALRYATGKYVLHLDADCSFFYDAVEEALLPFYLHKNIGAVSCALEVRNSSASLATKFQTIEYLLSINVGRMVNSSLGILQLVSGAFGAFRRDVLDEIGGWDVGPGLDGDITQKIKKTKRWKVVFAPNAVALTDVPDTFKKLTKQRLRWSRSAIRFRLRKHRNVFFPNENFNALSMLASFDNLFYNVFLNFTWWIYMFLILTNYIHRISYIFITIFLLYTISKFIEFAVVLFLSHHKKDRINLLLYIPGMVIYTAYYMRFIRTYAYLKELFTKSSFKDSWNPSKSSAASKKLEQKITAIFNKY